MSSVEFGCLAACRAEGRQREDLKGEGYGVTAYGARRVFVRGGLAFMMDDQLARATKRLEDEGRDKQTLDDTEGRRQCEWRLPWPSLLLLLHIPASTEPSPAERHLSRAHIAT